MRWKSVDSTRRNRPDDGGSAFGCGDTARIDSLSFSQARIKEIHRIRSCMIHRPYESAKVRIKTMIYPNTRREFLRHIGVSAALLPFVTNLPCLASQGQAKRKQRLVVLFSPDG